MRYFALILVCLTTILIGTTSFREKINGDENPIYLNVNKKSPATEFSKDGALKLEISGGTAPYEVRCIGPDFNYKLSNKDKIELKNLGKGNYLIIVRDQNGQIKHEAFEF